MFKKATLAAAAVLAFGTAHAENQIGLYFTPSANIDTRSNGNGDEFRGNGFGGVVRFDIIGTAFVTGEYSSVTYDEQVDNEFDLNQLRIGIGASLPLSFANLSAMVHAEVVNFDDDDSDDSSSETGGAIHAGLIFTPNPVFNVFAQGGYLSVDSQDGPEFKVGLNVNAGERIMFFSDYRVTRLEDDDDGAKIDVEDFHLGAALRF